MPVRIRYFAALKDRMGHSEDQVELAQLAGEGEVVRPTDLVAWLTERNAAARALGHASVRIIINDEIRSADTHLGPDDVVAFCPPFSGG